MNRDWLAVFEALKSVYADGAYSNMAINEALLHHKGCKESFVRNYAKGVLRDSIRLDYLIDSLASRGIAKIAPRPLILLRMGIYAIESLDSVPEHAAVSEAVRLAKKVARGTDAFVNGVLRSYIMQREELTIPSDRLDLKYSISQPIISLLSSQYGEDTEDILKGLKTASKTIIRVNRLRTDRDDVLSLLEKMGIRANKCEESPNAIAAAGSGIIASELFRDGLISMQSLSSMLAIEALDPKRGSAVLDMCAAPGGKSAYMAELMGDDGVITACDIYDHRLSLIEKNAKRLGISSIKTMAADGTAYDASLENSFDYVLCDVPCSGLGVMSTKPEIAFKSDVQSYDELISIQKAILRNAIKYAKPGARIEYSTCTLNKNENEKVIEEVMSQAEGSLLKLLEMKTLLPYNCKVGFFYAIFEKNS